jgi:hypothetical protein
MEGEQFDAITKSLTTRSTRRRVLRGVTSGLAGALAVLLGREAVEGGAKSRRHRRNRKGKATARVQAEIADKFDVEEVNDIFEDEFLTEECGFAVTHTVTGTIKSSVDQDGLALFRYRLWHELIGPGGTLSFPDVGIDKDLAAVQDGDTTVFTVQATGVLALRIVIPGQGVVAANTGREIRLITVDTTTGEIIAFEVIVDSGLDRPLEGAALEAVCEALA